jgi:CheY-like chemotaxis protein
MLEREGYKVTAVASAEEALLVTGAIDLLVTDVALPGLDGRQLADRLAARAPGLLVLYTSGYTEGALPAAIGERSFLQKPYTTKLLVRRIEEMLATRPTLSDG